MSTRETTYLIQTLASLLRGEAAPVSDAALDWHEFYRIAHRQGVANMVAYAVSGAPDEVLEKFQKARNLGVLREATQELELKLIREAFAKAGVRAMPLKGAVLKYLYPKPDMRAMSDLDLLFDAENDAVVHDILLGFGYRADLYRENSVDVYMKPPLMCLELHRSLVEEDNPWHAYFADAWTRADAAGQMTPEDFYVFLIAHFARHYGHRGSGLRPVMDLWVWRRAHTLDEPYLERELGTLGLLEFTRQMEALAAFWFGDGAGSPLLDELGESVLTNSLYGSRTTLAMANMVAPKENERFLFAKLRYLRLRLFPGVAFMATRYPILNKCAVLLPFCWVARWIKTIFRRETLEREVRVFSQMQEEETKKIQELHRKIGLK